MADEMDILRVENVKFDMNFNEMGGNFMGGAMYLMFFGRQAAVQRQPQALEERKVDLEQQQPQEDSERERRQDLERQEEAQARRRADLARKRRRQEDLEPEARRNKGSKAKATQRCRIGARRRRQSPIIARRCRPSAPWTSTRNTRLNN